MPGHARGRLRISLGSVILLRDLFLLTVVALVDGERNRYAWFSSTRRGSSACFTHIHFFSVFRKDHIQASGVCARYGSETIRNHYLSWGLFSICLERSSTVV